LFYFHVIVGLVSSGHVSYGAVVCLLPSTYKIIIIKKKRKEGTTKLNRAY
jgi:hypothetical protein